MFDYESFKNEPLKEKIYILNEISLSDNEALKQLFNENYEHKDHKLVQFQLQKIYTKVISINSNDLSDSKKLNLKRFYNFLKLKSSNKPEINENFSLFLNFFIRSIPNDNDNLLYVLIFKKLIKIFSNSNICLDKHQELIEKLSLFKINCTTDDYLVVKYSALIKLINFKRELLSLDLTKLQLINENYNCFMLNLKKNNEDYFSSNNNTLKIALRHEIFANYLLFILFNVEISKKLDDLDILSTNINKIYLAQDTLRIEFNLKSLNTIRNLCESESLKEITDKERLKNLLNPHKLFGYLIKSINFDCVLLVDWLISNETQFLEYLMRYLKYFQNNYDSYGDNLDFNDIKTLLTSLSSKIKQSERHFPYNCKPLIKLLDRIIVILK
jgi:hypothetical protein